MSIAILPPSQGKEHAKRALPPIPKCDFSGGIEDFHIIVGTRIPRAYPNFIWILPEPTQIFQVKHPNPSKILRPAHHLPSDLAFFPGSSVLGEPKERPLNLVDEL
jgi:hypothetical protein